MALQMIFCVETNKNADTDSVYLSETINSYYMTPNQVKISKIYMGTKSKYNSPKVLKEIEKKKRAFTIGETKVIYCIDTDDYESNYDHKKEFDKICLFCKENSYELIWFCHDVEDVFWRERVSDSQKVSKAADFRRQKKIQEVLLSKLSSKSLKNQSSNIMQVLDKYLDRKAIESNNKDS